MNQELTPADIQTWDSVSAVRQTFNELGFDPHRIDWFGVSSTTIDDVSEISFEFEQDISCAIILQEDLEDAWLVGHIPKPIGTPSIRYHQFEPRVDSNNRAELRETLDRLNALDPESPRSRFDALAKSELNSRFSNLFSNLIEDVAKKVDHEIPDSAGNSRSVTRWLVLSALRAKVISEKSSNSSVGFVERFQNTAFPTPTSVPETIKPLRQSLSNQQNGLSFVSDETVQLLCDRFESKFNRFDWLLTDTGWGSLDEVTAHTIGVALERHLTNKQGETYQTPAELTTSITAEAVESAVLERINTTVCETYTDLSEAIGTDLTSQANPAGTDRRELNQELLAVVATDIIPDLHIVDPAMGSGVFLHSALDSLVRLRSYIASVEDVPTPIDSYSYPSDLDNHGENSRRVWTTITQNLFGVDIDPEAVSLTRFRLELAYLCTLNPGEDPIPPRSEHNFKQGNSIVGKPFSSNPPYWSNQLPLSAFVQNDDLTSEHPHGTVSAQSIANEVRKPLEEYRSSIQSDSNPQVTIREQIRERTEAIDHQLEYKLSDNNSHSNQEGVGDVDPFHWPLEFPLVMERGGFDVVLFHGPWSESGLRDAVNSSTLEFLKSGWQYYLPDSGSWRQTNDVLDSFFLHRAHDVVRQGGVVASLVDASVLTDPGSSHIRRRYLETTDIERVATFRNQNTFDQIDRRFRYAVVVAQTTEQSGAFKLGSGFVTPEDLTDEGNYFELDPDFVYRFSPNTQAFPLLERDIQYRALQRLLEAPVLDDHENAEGWSIRPSGEFNQTTDSKYISETPYEGSDPIYRGKNIYQYAYQNVPEAEINEPDLWTIPQSTDQGLSTREYLREKKRTGNSGKLKAESSRIVYRRITRNTNERSMIACLLPSGYFHVNSLRGLDPYFGDQGNLGRRLVLLGLLNSIPYDYLLRQKISTSVPNYILFETRVPVVSEDHDLFDPIKRRVGKLNLVGEKFEKERQRLDIQGLESEVQRREVRAEVDAAAFDLYRFKDPEIVDRVLNDFGFVRNPRVMDSEYFKLVQSAFKNGDYLDES